MHRNLHIDAWRGLTIIAMVIYHYLWDLKFFFGYQIPLESWYWSLIAKMILISFLTLVGISWQLKHQRIKSSGQTNSVLISFLKQGARLLGIALLISLTTYALDSETYIRFGVLHLIGVATLTAPVWLCYPQTAQISAVAILLLSPFVQGISTNTDLLAPVGIVSDNFTSLDYVPLFPWMGIPILSSTVWGKKLSLAAYPYPSQPTVAHILVACASIGRHSLVIYLVHQPIIIALLYLLLKA